MTTTIEQRARRRATELGSKATTLRGIVRFLREHTAHTLPIRPNQRWQTFRLYQEWQDSQRARRSNPEASRARDDRKFRSRYLRALRKRERQICDADLSTLAAIAQRHAEQRILEAELQRVHDLREIVTGSGWREQLPLGDALELAIDEATARRVHAPLCMRGKDAEIYSTMLPSYGVHTAGETQWKGGRPANYTRATHDNYVRSMALVRSPRRVDVLLHDTEFNVELPEGYEWRTTSGHLSLVRLDSQRDDYHPDAGDLLAGAEHCIEQFTANRERRRKLEAERAVDIADAEGVWVCVADSLRAGNCRTMTIDFAKKHGFDPQRHYPAREVLIQSNGDYARVKLAVKAAIVRHRHEMEQGFCQAGE